MSTTLIEYRLLGPIEVRVDGQVLDIGGLKQRALLAMLLLRANEPVSRDVLVEQLWGDHPPAGAPHTIEVYVSRLRKVLAAAAGRPLVATRSAAYWLQVAPDELDVHRAERLAREGRHELAAGAPGAAAVKFGEALALWRGGALADLRYEPFFQAQISWLEEFRVGVFEDRIGADLAIGRQAGLIRELEPLIAAYPLRERLTGQLMVALCRCGRRGEALAAYDRARAVLAEELGLDPGPELRDLHARILVDDPSLTTATAVGALAQAGNGRAGPGDLAAGRDGAPGSAGATRGLPGVPRQLPAGAGFFAGRAAELKELDAILGQNAETSASVVIAAIGGMAGAGKTALAVRFGHQVAKRFPDGQLYVNLRGWDPGMPVLEPAEALLFFLD
ncbi:MAG TPA: AfsR/SARP family transcriptional regulator, partial [Streptosporangiaceae bacterium]